MKTTTSIENEPEEKMWDIQRWQNVLETNGLEKRGFILPAKRTKK